MTDTTPVLDRIEKEYCNALAREKGLDPVGYAGMFDGAIVLEIPLPWPRKVFLDPDKVTPEVVETVQTFYALPPEQRPRLVPMAIAPDHEYSIPGFRRFIRFNRQPGAAQFERIEYLVPEQHYGKLAQAALIAPERLSEFAPYRVDAPETRDLMVCTHGAVDAACAKFGFTLYRYLRQNHAGEHLRVWRCTHFGGHVFAPTLIDLPIGQYWAYVETPQADQIASRAGDHHNLRGHYRGWAGLHHRFLQAAEREAFMRVGWRWLDYSKTATITAQDESDPEKPAWGEVEITFASPDARHAGRYRMRVAVERTITTITTTGMENTHDYAQYRVVIVE
jgi:hypothetical protein